MLDGTPFLTQLKQRNYKVDRIYWDYEKRFILVFVG